MNTAAFSIDDLVSSLNGNHIGEDANNLKALHAQLAETLFNSASAQPTPSPQSSDTGPRCNTPTTRTPSSSISYSHSEFLLQPQRPSLRTDNLSFSRAMDEDMDDEAMVEDILMQPASPMVATPSSSMKATNPSSFHTYPYPPQPETPSLFTTSDPFYLDLAQSQNRPFSPSSTSVFAQAGTPCHTSPFLLGQPFQAPAGRQGRSDGFSLVSQTTPQPLMASAFDG